jgi:adenylate cyclase
LGDVVNVASRVQGATKYLGADCLITGETLQRLPRGVAVRRLARVQAVNIVQPIDLYEIVSEAPPDWTERCALYGDALEALERDEIDIAARGANELLERFPHDAAASSLVARISSIGGPNPLRDTAVWRLPGK